MHKKERDGGSDLDATEWKLIFMCVRRWDIPVRAQLESMAMHPSCVKSGGNSPAPGGRTWYYTEGIMRTAHEETSIEAPRLLQPAAGAGQLEPG